MEELNRDNFINRDLSWLRFNTRVLEEASNKNHPLLEQFKYLAIYGTNLDEFYMIRAAGLLEMEYEGMEPGSPDRMSATEQLVEIRKYLGSEYKTLEKKGFELFSKLEKEGLHIKRFSELTEEQKRKAETYFMHNIFPILIPIAVNALHPFPHLNNLSFAMGIKLKETSTGTIRFGLVRMPRVLSRFIEIDDSLFVPIESIVYGFIEELFPGFTPISHIPFRVTRNADMIIAEEEADDFMEVLEQGIKSRRKGKIVRVEFGAIEHDNELIDFLITNLEVDAKDAYSVNLPLNLGAYWQIVGASKFSYLTNKPYNPKLLPPFFNTNNSIFSTIDKQDVMLSLPYESFSPVEKLIVDASKDPKVLSIRITLYRVGNNSKIVKALMDAAESGKMVTAVVELKARFDEENNLMWAKALERAGAHVIYGIRGLKIHAKIAHIVRKSASKGLRHYVHLATGNYNPATAKIYTDISFFTSSEKVAEDATKFFHHITGFSKKTKLSFLQMAPIQIKTKVLSLIEDEIAKGKEGEIIAKVNSLVDPDVIKALYKASKAGVDIKLIVRGVCSVRPKIKGLSENIKVISIVGKYLEHSRIFYFKHAVPKAYFSSADWMTRNLNRRIELFTPVEDRKLAKYLEYFLRIQLADNVQTRELGSDGEYTHVKGGDKKISSQEVMEKIYSQANKKNTGYDFIVEKMEDEL